MQSSSTSPVAEFLLRQNALSPAWWTGTPACPTWQAPGLGNQYRSTYSKCLEICAAPRQEGLHSSLTLREIGHCRRQPWVEGSPAWLAPKQRVYLMMFVVSALCRPSVAVSPPILLNAAAGVHFCATDEHLYFIPFVQACEREPDFSARDLASLKAFIMAAAVTHRSEDEHHMGS